MSSPGDLDIETGTRPAFLPGAGPAPHSPHHRRDPRLRIGPEGVMTLPVAGQPGHGRMAFLRRQPVRIVGGRTEGGYTSEFELICPSCGDLPSLDYSEVQPRLQRLRGPRPLQAALAAYEEHLGPDEDGAGNSGARDE